MQARRTTCGVLIGAVSLALVSAAVSIAADSSPDKDLRPTETNKFHGHVPAQNEQAQRAPRASDDAADDYADNGRWFTPGSGAQLPANSYYENEWGAVQILNSSGPVDTAGHPFFTPLGSNGRACVTCHQPSDGMSISTRTAREVWRATDGKDPLFAPVDGSNCPSLPQDDPKSHSMLLEHGLFRVFLPWPPKAPDGSRIEPEFTLEVVEDPTGCNRDPKYGLKSDNPMVSIYRRPKAVANFKYIEPHYAQYFNLKTGVPLAKDPETGERVSMNLMADARNLTLKTQAVEASVTHLQHDSGLNEAQLAQIVAFERQLYMAQGRHKQVGEFGVEGVPPGLGARAMEREKYGLGNIMSNPVFKSFDAWRAKEGQTSKDADAEMRASIARGSDIFFVRPFWIRDTTGLNNIGLGNPLKRQCATCHNAAMTGHDVAPGWIDLGTQNLPTANPLPHLPLFKLTCRADAPPHAYLGRVIYTHDPGRALITGKCIEIGAINLQQMRGLAARAPYFSNGSAANLREVVDYYDRRFDIGYSEQEKQDLVNFLSVL